MASNPVRQVRIALTQVEQSLGWMRIDLARRLLPFGLLIVTFQLGWHPGWLGLTPGLLVPQLTFGVLGGLVMFGGAMLARRQLTRRRGALGVPSGLRDLALQGGYYVLNGPLEEGVFRGILQGGLAVLVAPPAGFLIGTAAYVLYHRLGRWDWADVGVTALVGVPLGLAFWLLPGPPSLLGVSLAHVGATCGFLGPGSYLLRRFRLL